MNEKKEKKQIKAIDPIIIIIAIVIAAALCTWILPGGSFERAVDPNSGAELVVPGTYTATEKNPVSFMGFLMSFTQGMQKAGSVIFFLLIVGGIGQLHPVKQFIQIKVTDDFLKVQFFRIQTVGQEKRVVDDEIGTPQVLIGADTMRDVRISDENIALLHRDILAAAADIAGSGCDTDQFNVFVPVVHALPSGGRNMSAAEDKRQSWVQ